MKSDIVKILERFAGFELSDQAWILGTLLDFRAQNLDIFERRYGTFAKERIADLFEG